MPIGDEILATVTRGLLGSIEGRNLDRARLLANAGLSEDSIGDPDAWVPLQNHVALGRAITEALPGQNLGLQTGAKIFGDPKGALGYSLRRSEHLWRALKNFCSYLGVVNRSLSVELSLVPTACSLSLRMERNLSELGHPAEALFAAWVAIARHLCVVPWCPERVHFGHAPRGDQREHAEFFGCEVSFGSEPSELVLSATAWSLHIEKTPHGLEPSLLAARDAAQRLAVDADERRALAELATRLTSVPLDVRSLAPGASPATLPLRLALARGLLEQSRLFVHEVAFLLGFECLREFINAFQTRFNLEPASLRAVS